METETQVNPTHNKIWERKIRRRVAVAVPGVVRGVATRRLGSGIFDVAIYIDRLHAKEVIGKMRNGPKESRPEGRIHQLDKNEMSYLDRELDLASTSSHLLSVWRQIALPPSSPYPKMCGFWVGRRESTSEPERSNQLAAAVVQAGRRWKTFLRTHNLHVLRMSVYCEKWQWSCRAQKIWKSCAGWGSVDNDDRSLHSCRGVSPCPCPCPCCNLFFQPRTALDCDFLQLCCWDFCFDHDAPHRAVPCSDCDDAFSHDALNGGSAPNCDFCFCRDIGHCSSVYRDSYSACSGSYRDFENYV